MIHQMIPGTDELLRKGMTSGYIGFDPTADSLGIGNMVQVMTLTHFQRCGHKPVALVGGATGMVGDPSGKSSERNLLDEEALRHNLACQQAQLEKFLDFDCGANSAELVNNYDWFKEFDFLGFIRDVGKHISVNYMMAKDSVKKRLDSKDGGMSFTEFSYQLVQGYDFYHLWKNNNCMLQMGGSDQWGNITTGTEMIGRLGSGKAYALTTPLITKADGTKFGKSEGGNLWLDKTKTSAYKFYQYWINASDDDIGNYMRIFSVKGREEIESLEAEHVQDKGRRLLQMALAEELTLRVHSEADLKNAVEASQVLFGKNTSEVLKGLPVEVLLDVFEGVPQGNVSKITVENGVNIIDLLSEHTGFLKSKGEARRALSGNAISVNKAKVTDSYEVSTEDIIGGKYVLLSNGRKNHFLIILN